MTVRTPGNENNPVTKEVLEDWATNPRGPVALHLKQRLLPVEGEGGIVFPPTYADIGYNIDTLQDGTKVALIDSVGSQANRLEPIFKTRSLAKLVPQIEIIIRANKDHQEKCSILDLAHRSADAVVQSCPGLAQEVSNAFEALKQTGDAGPLCALAPTSLVFGVWDSRGGSGEKRPRLVRAIIRAWDVEQIYAAAQFNSVSKMLDEAQQNQLEDEAKKKKTKLSEKGFADAPATFRKVSQSAAKYMKEFREGSPNPERRVLGGVIARGAIERDITVNLVALRGIRGKDPKNTACIQKYLLGLSLLAATWDIDLFLREGCLLRYADESDRWLQVPRRGDPIPVDISSADARQVIEEYASDAAEAFNPNLPQTREYKFDLKEAKRLLAKKNDEGEDG